VAHTRKRAAGQLTLLLLGQAYLSAGITLRAEGTATGPTSAIVWKIDNTAVIGGKAPQVIGAPKIINASVGEIALQFNGRGDGLIVPVNPIAGWSSFTIEVLFQPDANGPRAQRFLHIADRLGSRALVETRTTDGKSWILDTYLARPTKKGRTLRNRTKRHPTGKWAWVALVYDGYKMTHYVNGVREFEGRTIFPPMADGVTSIGMRLNKVFWFKGNIKEIRFTPAALATDALQHMPEK
jgi:hypothetical protein